MALRPIQDYFVASKCGAAEVEPVSAMSLKLTPRGIANAYAPTMVPIADGRR